MVPDTAPSVDQLVRPEGAPTCPACGSWMDIGEYRAMGSACASFTPSVHPEDTRLWVSHRVGACVNCGHMEFMVDPVELREVMAGVKRPKPPKPPKRGFFG
jgi:hypothetical protein